MSRGSSRGRMARALYADGLRARDVLLRRNRSTFDLEHRSSCEHEPDGVEEPRDGRRARARDGLVPLDRRWIGVDKEAADLTQRDSRCAAARSRAPCAAAPAGSSGSRSRRRCATATAGRWPHRAGAPSATGLRFGELPDRQVVLHGNSQRCRLPLGQSQRFRNVPSGSSSNETCRRPRTGRFGSITAPRSGRRAENACSAPRDRGVHASPSRRRRTRPG